MKYVITIFFFLPLAAMAQKTDSVQCNLHRTTDSFFINRCRAICARNAGEIDSFVFYDGRARHFREMAFEYYQQWDPQRYDAKKQKRNLRFMNPNKYFKCPCQ